MWHACVCLQSEYWCVYVAPIRVVHHGSPLQVFPGIVHTIISVH